MTYLPPVSYTFTKVMAGPRRKKGITFESPARWLVEPGEGNGNDGQEIPEWFVQQQGRCNHGRLCEKRQVRALVETAAHMSRKNR